MVRYRNDRHKKTWLGRDKGVAALQNFEAKLRAALLAMVLDGILERTAGAGACYLAVVGEIEKFAEIYPNWTDAYAFGYEYFILDKSTATTRLGQLMRQ